MRAAGLWSLAFGLACQPKDPSPKTKDLTSHFTTRSGPTQFEALAPAHQPQLASVPPNEDSVQTNRSCCCIRALSLHAAPIVDFAKRGQAYQPVVRRRGSSPLMDR